MQITHGHNKVQDTGHNGIGVLKAWLFNSDMLSHSIDLQDGNHI